MNVKETDNMQNYWTSATKCNKTKKNLSASILQFKVSVKMIHTKCHFASNVIYFSLHNWKLYVLANVQICPVLTCAAFKMWFWHVLHSKCCYVHQPLPISPDTTHHNMPWSSKACGVWATTGSVMLVFIARTPPVPILQAPCTKVQCTA